MSPHYISFLRRRKAYNAKLDKASLKKKAHSNIITGLEKELEARVGISVHVERKVTELSYRKRQTNNAAPNSQKVSPSSELT